ncbi:hypothetical protein PR202_ga10570 [Eleusine coracana subsp. coracana]|uniref:F-box/LRR-repeat protein 15/At3g58940/PEG3-like LRR domain-containing protein n=1 Tax=Eleusine coracana subsp. coracana TaxID=191504 RepID=A0AAV5C720_ELECO|nr:hypothetical protein PR202_ga10570 [Eleusine coracana subsp. coracana]
MEGPLPVPKPLVMEEEVIATGAAKKTLPPMLTVTMKAHGVQPTPTNERSTHGQELLLTDAMRKEEGEGIDHISDLPDDILGTIVSILPTAKDVARTQVIAPQWRHIWLTVPLSLNLADLPEDNETLNNAVSGILSAHPGPGNSFCVQSCHLYEQNTTLSAWLRSLALNNLKELNLWDELSMFSHFHVRWKSPPPMSAVRFSTTLQVASLCKCKLTGTPIDMVHFPQLRQLALDQVIISKDLLHTMISNCSVLEFLLLNRNSGYGRVRINSSSLRSIGVGWNISNEPFVVRSKKLIIQDAPSLERVINLQPEVAIYVSIISAPKLETLGSISESSTFGFGGKAIIKYCVSGESNNEWRHKHMVLTKNLNIPLKTIVLEPYLGIDSHINFASFFILNAKELELMKLRVNRIHYYKQFFAEQHKVLEMEKRASRDAQLDFVAEICSHDYLHIDHVRDLSLTDPFECRS